MHADSQYKRTDAPGAVDSDALAQGLMLVRASTLKVIRLQLAMERKDRRVALEAVDDLVALDRRLQDYLSDVAAPELDLERDVLNHEKWALAAGVIRAEPKPEPEPEPEAVEPDAWQDFTFEEPRRSRAIWWLAGLILILAAAIAAYWFGGAALLGAIA